MTRTTAWDVWCPHCQRYWYMWRWTAEGKASEYAPYRVCLKCGCATFAVGQSIAALNEKEDEEEGGE